jgi:hypothetical protein
LIATQCMFGRNAASAIAAASVASFFCREEPESSTPSQAIQGVQDFSGWALRVEFVDPATLAAAASIR